MEEKTFNISKEELNLIRFYGGIDSVIYKIESLIEQTERKKIGDWEQIVQIEKKQLKLIKTLRKRMDEFFYPEDYQKEN